MVLDNTIKKHMVISLAGLGIAIGSLATIAPLPVLVIFGIGSGLMLGGVFRILMLLAGRTA